MKRWSNNNIHDQTISFSDIFTGRLREEIPKALDAFVEVFKDKENLYEIDLSDNAFGPAGALPLIALFRHNRNIQVLKLNNNGLGISGGTLIANALLESHQQNVLENVKSNLRVLIAGRNRLENGSMDALGTSLESHGTLREVRLPQNGIRPEGIVRLVKSLAKNPDLEILDVQDNTMTESGAKALAEVLSHWKNLRILNIGDCLLGSKGAIAIFEALKGLDKLETIILTYNEINEEAASVLATVLLDLKNIN